MSYFYGNICTDCMKAAEIIKPLFSENHPSDLKFVFEEIDVDFPGSLDPLNISC